MFAKPQMTEIFLEKIVEAISISSTMDSKARTSYQSVGKWLGDGLADYDVIIMPQGSFNLGTVIKPISEKDDYDIDLVCLLAKGHELALSDYQIKNSVGDRLKENKAYKDKLDKEGKRCWTLEYEEFHMDILPCIPQGMSFSKESHLTQIHLTHKIAPSKYEPHYSNPEGYLEWFESCMRDTLLEAKSRVIRASSEIERVPTYSVKTPLQKAIQLMKRHRDIMFKNDDENSPISILITTLAAKAYNGTRGLLETLTHISEHLEEGISFINNTYVVDNPAYPGENFAEKWNIDSAKPVAFFKWLKKLKADVVLLNEHNLLGNERQIASAFGEYPVRSGLNTVYPNGPNVVATQVHNVEIVKPNRPWGDFF